MHETDFSASGAGEASLARTSAVPFESTDSPPCTEALELYPTDAWALKNRGLAWKELGEAEKAEEDWKQAKEIEPGVRVPE